MTDAPKCRRCFKKTEAADAGILRSIPYWYCRTCKIEVSDYGFEVKAASPRKVDGIEELDEYLSGELHRFDNESPTAPAPEFSVTRYDPFLKRNRTIPWGQQLTPRPVEDETEADEEEPDFLWDTPGMYTAGS